MFGESIFVHTGASFEATPPVRLTYEAAEGSTKRKMPAVSHRSEDAVLDPSRRSRLLSNARDLARNFSIAAWMVRRHLDYVATFDFHMRTEDEGLNSAIEDLVWEWQRPHNFDIAGRHGLDRVLRIVEGRAVLDGDCGLMKIANGMVQGIEGDRVRTPEKANGQWVHGVKVNDVGRALAYGIHRRGGTGGFEFAKIVPANNLCMHGYFDRFDQVRGISPMASALNPLRDAYENVGYALAKSKVAQLFALAFYRDANEAAGDVTTLDGEEQPSVRGRYQIDFGRGPVLLDMEPGDRAEFLENKTPSTEFQAFMLEVLSLAMKALDIPYSFYNEAHTNFFGSRAAWLHYQRSCKPKRDALIDLLNRLTTWRLMLWILDGQIKLPRTMTMRDLWWEWVPMGMPWWDPSKEINGDKEAIGAGLDNPQRIVKERGRGDFYDNLRQIAKAKKAAADLGIELNWMPTPQVVEVVAADEVK